MEAVLGAGATVVARVVLGVGATAGSGTALVEGVAMGATGASLVDGASLGADVVMDGAVVSSLGTVATGA